MVYCSAAPSHQTATNVAETHYSRWSMEMAMKLEASPLEETTTGMTTLQNQLANLTLQIHELKKGKEVMQDIWCLWCKSQGHTKDNCPVFAEYLRQGLLTRYHKRKGHGVKYARHEDMSLSNAIFFRSMYRHLRTYTLSSTVLSDMMNRISKPMISC